MSVMMMRVYMNETDSEIMIDEGNVVELPTLKHSDSCLLFTSNHILLSELVIW